MQAISNAAFDPSHIAPRMAIVFSGTAHSLTSVAKHSVEGGVIQAGEYLDPTELLEILDGIVNNRGMAKEAAILPANVLVNSNNKLVWYQPARVAPFWFVASGQERNHLRIKWPALLFEINKSTRRLRCVALDSDNRPTADSPVYNLPMPNAYDGGGFCLGSAALPNELGVKTMADVESCVYDAVKTHSNNPKAIKTGESPTNYWCRRAKAAGKKPATILKRDLTRLATLSRWLELAQ